MTGGVVENESVPVLHLADEEEQVDTRQSQEQIQNGKEKKIIGLKSVSSIVVVSLGLVGMVEYSLVMPSMNEFVVKKLGGTDLFYGCSMAAFSLARLSFMPLLGMWSDRRPMIEPFLFSISLGIIGNCLYGCAEWADNVWFVLIGRALVGMGAANSTLSMSYITRITTSETRTKALATLNGINLLGIVLGPATNMLIDFEWAVPRGSILHGLVFDKYTNPGWAMFLILSIICILLVACFDEPPKHTSDDEFDEDEEDNNHMGSTEFQSSSGSSSLSASDLEEPFLVARPKRTWKAIFSDLFFTQGLWIHFVISFVSSFVLAELETSFPKLTNIFFGWDTLTNSIMYALIGIVTAITLIVTGVLSKRISDRRFITVGNVVYGVALLLGCIFLHHAPSLAMFSFVSVLLVIAAPITDSPNLAFYSKRLQGEREAVPYLGLFIGFIQASNAVARTAAPLYAGWALMAKNDYLAIYLGPMIMWTFSAVALVFRYKSLESTKPSVLKRTPSIASFTSFESIMQSPLLTPVMN